MSTTSIADPPQADKPTYHLGQTVRFAVKGSNSRRSLYQHSLVLRAEVIVVMPGAVRARMLNGREVFLPHDQIVGTVE